MRILEQITKNVWKLKGESNIYLLDFTEPIVIDTGNRADRDLILRFLDKLKPLLEIRHVIFTHLHYDHIGNFDLFKNARFYASEAEIKCFEKDPEATTLSRDMAEKFTAKLNIAHDMAGLEVIQTPGHTVGSICIWYPYEKILFSGDTLFSDKRTGRVDLATSDQSRMQESVMKLVNYNFKILLPGHS
ncbi:MAG: MBL fold metallo-hydrolase [Candidatus Woesearchaeota archaeon]